MKNWDKIEFQLREGVFLKNICDENILFAVKDAADYCRHVQTVNETAAYFWTKLSEGKSVEQIIKDAAIEFEISENEIRSDFFCLLDQFYQLGYILVNQDGGQRI